MGAEWLPALYAAGLLVSIGAGWGARAQVGSARDRAWKAEQKLWSAQLQAARTEIEELRVSFAKHAKAVRKLNETQGALRRLAGPGADPAAIAKLLRGNEPSSESGGDPPAPPSGEALPSDPQP